MKAKLSIFKLKKKYISCHSRINLVSQEAYFFVFFFFHALFKC